MVSLLSCFGIGRGIGLGPIMDFPDPIIDLPELLELITVDVVLFCSVNDAFSIMPAGSHESPRLSNLFEFSCFGFTPALFYSGLATSAMKSAHRRTYQH